MSATRPNVIVFVADDLGWGDLGCYGATRIHTPAIDALAERGALFSDAHATSAVCTPSRYSLVTGRYPWRSPLKSGVLGGTDPSIIRPGEKTLASQMRAGGYATGAFGKWHLGMNWTNRDGVRASAFAADAFIGAMQADGRDIDYSVPVTGGPIDHGFDRFFGLAGSLDMPPYCFIEQDLTVGIPDQDKSPRVTSQRPGYQVPGWRDDHVDIETTRQSIAWITEQVEAGDPFFAYIAAVAPHRPCVPPDFLLGSSGAGLRGDCVQLVDWMVASITDALGDIGALDDTVFIFTSDNGAPLIFPEDGDVTTHKPNGAWRGQKGDTWEGGHRVPLIIAGAATPEAQHIERPVSLMDIVPTVLELAGLAASATSELDGVSLTALLGDPDGADDPAHDDRVLGQQAFDGALTLRRGNNKAIFSSGSGGFSEPLGRPQTADDASNQFYDLALDPGELNNLWHDFAESGRTMLNDFEAIGFTMNEEGGAR